MSSGRAGEDVSLRGAFEAYLTHLSARGARSLRTIQAYAVDVSLVIRSLGIARDVTVGVAWNSVALERAIAEAQKTRRSPASIARLMSSLRGFEVFCVAQGYLASEPVRDMERPTLERRRRVTITRAELEGALDSLPMHTEAQRRDRAIVELLLGSGVKVSEVVALDTAGFERSSRVLSVRNVAGELRRIQLTPRTATALASYLDFRMEVNAVVGPILFPGRGRGRISVRTVQRAVRRSLKAVSLKSRVTPQGVRECVAAWRLREGATRGEVQELLGLRSRSILNYVVPGDESVG